MLCPREATTTQVKSRLEKEGKMWCDEHQCVSMTFWLQSHVRRFSIWISSVCAVDFHCCSKTIIDISLSHSTKPGDTLNEWDPSLVEKGESRNAAVTLCFWVQTHNAEMQFIVGLVPAKMFWINHWLHASSLNYIFHIWGAAEVSMIHFFIFSCRSWWK